VKSNQINILDNYIDLFRQIDINFFMVLNHLLEVIYQDSKFSLSLEELSELSIEQTENIRNYSFKSGINIISTKVVIEEQNYYFLSKDIKHEYLLFEELENNNIIEILNGIPEGISIIKNKKVVFRNTKLRQMLAIKDGSFGATDFSKYLDGVSFTRLSNALTDDGEKNLILNLINEDNKVIWVKAEINIIKQKSDLYHIVSLSDITSETEDNQRLDAEKEYLKQTLKSINEGVIICDKANNITLLNEVASSISGYLENDVLHKPVQEIIRIISNDDILVDYLSSDSYKNDNVLIVSKDDLFRHVSISVSNILDQNNKVLGKVIVLIDMSEMKKHENEIVYLSYHDILTGLYNRTFLEFELKRLDTKRQLPFSIIMGDVNGLKMTNDVFGHEAGDLLLKKVAKILKKSCRQEDIIGRWGGDEFIILLPNTPDEETFVVMKRIIRDFNALNVLDSVSGLIPSVSLGYGVKKNVDDDIYETLRIAESNMYKRKMLSAESIYSSIITSMKTALFEKSNETEEHTNRLFSLCYKIGTRYNLSSDEFNDLELLCMLHDIGKIGISDAILKKASALSKEEWVEMKTHPEIGFRIAQATPELKKVANYILYHHERFDGKGYPIGLKAYDIPLIDRILSVVDSFDAMTNDRTYRKALDVDQAISELLDNSGTQFDPDVVKIFMDIIK